MDLLTERINEALQGHRQHVGGQMGHTMRLGHMHGGDLGGFRRPSSKPFRLVCQSLHLCTHCSKAQLLIRLTSELFSSTPNSSTTSALEKVEYFWTAPKCSYSQLHGSFCFCLGRRGACFSLSGLEEKHSLADFHEPTPGVHCTKPIR